MHKPNLPETDKELKPLETELKDVWEPMHTDPGRILWHYTSADGLKGILESCTENTYKPHLAEDGTWALEKIPGSCTLRATNVYYMNDTREVTYARDLMLEEIYQRKGLYAAPVDEFLGRIESRLQISDMISQPHVACFCDEESGDLLSQWRGYASGNGGYALGFRSASLRTHGPDTPLRRVIYDEATQRKLIGDTLDRFWMALVVVAPFVSSPPHKLGQAIGDFSRAIARFFDEYVSCFKHPKFAEEREWRLVQSVVPFKTANGSLVNAEHVRFRVARGLLVPYVELNIGAEDPNDEKWRLPLEQITIGPTLHHKQAENSLKQILDQHDYDTAHPLKIEFSEIPLAW